MVNRLWAGSISGAGGPLTVQVRDGGGGLAGRVERDGWIEDAVSEAESSRFTDGSDGRRVVMRANQKTRMTLEFC